MPWLCIVLLMVHERASEALVPCFLVLIEEAWLAREICWETRYMLPGVSTYPNCWVCCCCHDRRFHQVWRTTLLCSSCGFEKSPALLVWFREQAFGAFASCPPHLGILRKDDCRFHKVWRTTLLHGSCGFEKSPAVVVWFQNRRLCFRIVSIASGDPQKGCFSFSPRSWRKSKTCLVCDAELPGRAAVAEVGPAACGCGFVPRKSSP